MHLRQNAHVLCLHMHVCPLGHFQGLLPIVAPVDGIDHVLVHQAWLLITLPLPFLLAGAGEREGRSEGMLGSF